MGLQVHMQRPLLRAWGRLDPVLCDQFQAEFATLRELLQELPPTGKAQLLAWLERRPEMTRHQQQPEVPPTTNRLEGRWGRLKPRYRQTRGLKTW